MNFRKYALFLLAVIPLLYIGTAFSADTGLVARGGERGGHRMEGRSGEEMRRNAEHRDHPYHNEARGYERGYEQGLNTGAAAGGAGDVEVVPDNPQPYPYPAPPPN